MNKIEAAEFLGCSVRAVERYAAAGKLASRYERGKTGKILVFEQDELARFKAELETPLERGIVTADKPRQAMKRQPSTDTTSTALVHPDGALNPQSIELLQAFAQWTVDNARQSPTVPTEAKLLLTLNEVKALTGLSRETLRDAIKAGKLKAQLIGRGWKVKRTDLDNYIAKL